MDVSMARNVEYYNTYIFILDAAAETTVGLNVTHTGFRGGGRRRRSGGHKIIMKIDIGISDDVIGIWKEDSDSFVTFINQRSIILKDISYIFCLLLI
jgi:hypothetical protein